jgi:hypothetical protein
MSVLNVEVDPKAIEAAAQDEPPEYIPTDVVGGEEEGELAETDTADGPTTDENTAPVTAAAVATAAAIAATNTTNDTAPSNLDKWKEVIMPRDEQEDEDIHFPEPSMDDFFHEEEH